MSELQSLFLPIGDSHGDIAQNRCPLEVKTSKIGGGKAVARFTLDLIRGVWIVISPILHMEPFGRGSRRPTFLMTKKGRDANLCPTQQKKGK